MNSFSNNNDPKIIPKLSSDSINPPLNSGNVNTVLNPNTPVGAYNPPKLVQNNNSASFKKTDVKYANGDTYNEVIGQAAVLKQLKEETRQAYKVEERTQYGIDDSTTENMAVERPKSSDSSPIKLEEKISEPIPIFTKAPLNFDNLTTPVDMVLNDTNNVPEKIEIIDNQETYKNNDFKKKDNSKRKKYMLYICIGIGIELLVIGIIALVKMLNSTTTLDCTMESHNDYYGANIIIEKKYYFKNDAVTKLEETTKYKFDTKESYTEYKDTYASAPYENIAGRIVISNINDNNLTYEEKITYDYKKLINNKNNESKDPATILINTSNADQPIDLINLDKDKTLAFYQSDYTCK